VLNGGATLPWSPARWAQPLDARPRRRQDMGALGAPAHKMWENTGTTLWITQGWPRPSGSAVPASRLTTKRSNPFTVRSPPVDQSPSLPDPAADADAAPQGGRATRGKARRRS